MISIVDIVSNHVVWMMRVLVVIVVTYWAFNSLFSLLVASLALVLSILLGIGWTSPTRDTDKVTWSVHNLHVVCAHLAVLITHMCLRSVSVPTIT